MVFNDGFEILHDFPSSIHFVGIFYIYIKGGEYMLKLKKSKGSEWECSSICLTILKSPKPTL